jgi:hypothetical protein
MPITIREHKLGQNLDLFIRAGHEVFRGDPAWIPPLEMELRDRLTPGKNPFFEHAQGALFTAHDGDRVVGRISAQIDEEHLRLHRDDAGFFGFFDTIDDPKVATRLVEEASVWLRQRGMKRTRGPFSLNINEECGLLVGGFEHPPVIMMAHSRPYQSTLAEAAGLTKIKDLFAWRYDVAEIKPRAERAWKQIKEMPEVRLRSVDKSKMESELRIVMDIFNDAWSDNWGFVPATEAELVKTAKDMKLIIDEELAFIAEVDGAPAGMCICIPNVNEAIRDLGGKLLPFGIPKILWRMKVKNPKTGRLMLLGIKKEYRGRKKYGGLSMAMYVELATRGRAKGYQWGELSWTLEDNHPINLGIKAMGAKVYKTYRLYEKELGA